MAKTYTCAACNGVFDFDDDWTDEDAIAEKENNFGAMPMDGMSIVCDDCYRRIFGLPALGEKKDAER